jgi:hypothetical protein
MAPTARQFCGVTDSGKAFKLTVLARLILRQIKHEMLLSWFSSIAHSGRKNGMIMRHLPPPEQSMPITGDVSQFLQAYPSRL